MRDTKHLIHAPSLVDLIPTVKAKCRNIPDNAKSLEFYFNEKTGTLSFKFFFGEMGRVALWTFSSKTRAGDQFEKFPIQEAIFLHELIEVIEPELELYLSEHEKGR